MTIREKVTRAICLLFEGEDKCPFGRKIPPSDEPYMEDGGFEITGKEIDEWSALTGRAATAAINAFLAAAADDGWRMTRDEPTEEMHQAGVNGMFTADEFDPVETIWRAMVADPTAQFEWDK